MLWMFFGAVVLGVLCLFWYCNSCNRGSDVEYWISGTIAVICLIFVVIGGLAWGVSYGTSVGINAEMSIFHDTTLANYRYAIDATSQINIKSDNLVNDPSQKNIVIDLGKLTHQNMAQTVGLKIDELVSKVNQYHTWLALMRKYDTNWFLDAFYEDPDPKLQFIVLQLPKNP